MLFDNWAQAIKDYGRRRSGEESEGESRGSQAVLDQISGTQERVFSSDFGGGRTMRVTHPFVSIRSWIRVMPEPGTAAVVQTRADTQESEIVYYWSGFPEDRITDYYNQKGHYRSLFPGEIEISSTGIAQSMWSARGALHLRGGVVRGWLHNDLLEAGFKAPVHRRLLHDYSHDLLTAEERFGAVWRKGSLHTERKWVKVEGNFAREYSRFLSYSGTPPDLVRYQEGHVIDEMGKQSKSPIRTNLRIWGRWFDVDNEAMALQVDEHSNIWLTLTNRATTGLTLRIPKGNLRIEAGENIQLGAVSDVEISGYHMIVKARGVLNLEGTQAVNITSSGAVSITAPNIQINSRVVHPGVQPI